MLRSTYWLFVLALIVTSCYKDDESIDTDYIPDPPRKEVEAHLTGFVLRDGSTYLGGVSVSNGANEVMTDENGYFDLDKCFNDQDLGLLRISKEGYYTTLWPFSSLAGHSHVLRPSVIPLSAVEKANPSNTHIFDFGIGLSMSIPENVLIDPLSGSRHSDDYLASAHVLTSNEKSQQFGPAHLARLGDIHKSKTLISIERAYSLALQSTTGGELHVMDSISLQLPALKHEQAIYVQNENGQYEAATFEMIGQDKIQIKLKNFYSILIGQPLEARPITGRAQINDNTPLSYHRITFNGELTTTTTTTDKGNFRSWIPLSSKTLSYEDRCGNIVDEHFIQGTSSDPEALNLNLSFENFVTIEGNLFECTGEKVKKGFVEIHNDDSFIQRVPMDINGEFRVTLLNCDQSQIYAIFFNQNGEEIAKSKLPEYGTLAGQSIINCPQAPQAEAIITVDGATYYYPNCLAQVHQSGHQLTSMQFIISNAQFDEIHDYIFENGNGAEYWKSPSSYTVERFKIASISGKPKVTQFEIGGITYQLIEFSDILFQSASQQKKRGQAQYIYALN